MYRQLLENHLPAGAINWKYKIEEGYICAIYEYHGETRRSKFKLNRSGPRKRSIKPILKRRFQKIKSIYPIEYFIGTKELTEKEFYQIYFTGKYVIDRFYKNESGYKFIELVLREFKE